MGSEHAADRNLRTAVFTNDEWVADGAISYMGETGKMVECDSPRLEPLCSASGFERS